MILHLYYSRCMFIRLVVCNKLHQLKKCHGTLFPWDYSSLGKVLPEYYFPCFAGFLIDIVLPGWLLWSKLLLHVFTLHT